MKVLKKLGRFLLILVSIILIAAALIPILFKKQITEFVKQTINENIEATVDFEEAQLSFFRSFPNLNFRLSNFEVLGNAPFDSIYLLKGANFDAAVNMISAIRPPLKIKTVNLDETAINIVVLESGKANYDILPTSESESTSSTESNLVVELESYRIKEGAFSYKDKSLGLLTNLSGINHTGKGNFTLEVFDFDTETTIEDCSIYYDGTKYLDNANLKLDAIVNADITNQKYTLKDNALYLNELKLHADGFVQVLEEAIALDLVFDAPDNDFKELISMLPNVYTEDFGAVKATGAFELNGSVKGNYSTTETTTDYPAFSVAMKTAKGTFQYPDLPLPITNINSDLTINHPGGDLDKMIIDLKNFSLQLAEEQIEGFLNLKTPISDPNLNAKVKGNLNLAQLAKAYPLDGVKEMAGRIKADVRAKATYSQITQEQYERVELNGSVVVEDVLYRAEGLPDIRVQDATARLSQKGGIAIDKFEAMLGKSDLSAQGNIQNPLAYLAEGGIVKGNMRVRSNFFGVDEWMTESETSSEEVSTPASTPQQVGDQYQFDIDANMKKMVYANYNLSDLTFLGNLTANDLQVKQLTTIVNGSDLKASGSASNLHNFLFANDVLQGKFNISAGKFDLDQLLATEEVATNESTQTETTTTEASVPNFQYDLDVVLAADNVIYSPYKLSDFKATGKVGDQNIQINTFSTKLFDSDLKGKGNLSNYLAYVFVNDTLRGDFDLQSNFLNLNSILASEEYTANVGTETPQTAQPEELEAYILPAVWDFAFHAKAQKVLYADLELRDMVGKLTIKRGRLVFEDTKGKGLGGELAVAGGYDTQDPEKPSFNIKLDLGNVDIPTTFKTFNTFQAMAPVGRFIQGKLNSTFLFASVLGQDMMPDLKTINAEGFLETLNAAIKSYAPLQKTGQLLGTDLFETLEITNSKNWFIVKDGTIKLEEAKFKAKDATMTISGTHTLDQQINYTILATVPRDKIGSTAQQGLSFLENKATSLGLNLSAGSHINLKINLNGALANPKISIVPTGSENRTSVKEIVKDKVSQEVEDAKKEAKNELKETVNDQKSKIDSTVNKAKQEANQQIDSLKNKAKDEAAKAIEEEINEIKNKINKFNPFKKGKG